MREARAAWSTTSAKDEAGLALGEDITLPMLRMVLSPWHAMRSNYQCLIDASGRSSGAGASSVGGSAASSSASVQSIGTTGVASA